MVGPSGVGRQPQVVLMREEHAVCVKFTQALVLTKQIPLIFW
jgi:hypothetical protein